MTKDKWEQLKIFIDKNIAKMANHTGGSIYECEERLFVAEVLEIIKEHMDYLERQEKTLNGTHHDEI